MTVPTVRFTDERLPNGLRRDQRGPPGPRGRREPLVRRRLQARAARQDRVRAPVRACDVPGQPARREGGAHRPGAGRRRLDERHDVARPHQLTSRRCLPTSWSWRCGWRPTGSRTLLDALSPGEPGQPARGGEEREAVLVRQPAVRELAGEDARPPLPGRSSLSPPDDRLHGGPRCRVPGRRRRLLPRPTTRRTTPCSRSSATSIPAQARAWVERYFGPIPANPAIPRSTSTRCPADAGRRGRETGSRPGPATARLRRLPRAAARRRAPLRPGDRRPRSWRAARGAASTAAWCARSGSPRTSRSSASASRPARPSSWAGRPSGPESTPEAVEAAAHEEIARLGVEPITDDELARAKALIETDELARRSSG